MGEGLKRAFAATKDTRRRKWFCYGHNGTFMGKAEDYCPTCFPNGKPSAPEVSKDRGA